MEFHHAEHLHPLLDNVIGTTCSITVARDYDQLYNTFYRIVLTVTDRSGLKSTAYVDVTPNLVTLTFGSNDPDATYAIDGLPYRGQRPELVVVGVRRTLGAPSIQQVRNGQQLAFGSVSGDVRRGSRRSHRVDSTRIGLMSTRPEPSTRSARWPG